MRHSKAPFTLSTKSRTPANVLSHRKLAPIGDHLPVLRASNWSLLVRRHLEIRKCSPQFEIIFTINLLLSLTTRRKKHSRIHTQIVADKHTAINPTWRSIGSAARDVGMERRAAWVGKNSSWYFWVTKNVFMWTSGQASHNQTLGMRYEDRYWSFILHTHKLSIRRSALFFRAFLHPWPTIARPKQAVYRVQLCFRLRAHMALSN